MDRAERTGLGVAVIAHAALFAVLSLNLLKPPALPKLDSTPIDVSLVDETALTSSSPAPSPAAPAPASAPMESAAPEAQAEEPAPPPPQPVAKPAPKQAPAPTPKPVAKPPVQQKPAVKPAPQKTAAKPPAKPQQTASRPPVRKPGLSRSLVEGLEDSPAQGKAAKANPSKATGVSAAQMTGAQKASLNAQIYRQLKPFWKPPSGADAEQLVTFLEVRLNKDGSLAGDPQVLEQKGITDSNRAQAKLHAERAIQAVRRAAPFDLPSEYYDAWKWLKPLKLYVGQPG